MNKPTLISINSELMDLASQREMILVESEGEITPENTAIISELEFRIRSLLTQNKEKVSSYCGFLDSIEVEAAFCDQKIKEVQQYVKRLRSTQDWLLLTAKGVIESGGEPLSGNFGNKISLRTSKSVEVTCDPSCLPVHMQRVKIEADKSAIKAALENGSKINGCKIIEKKSVVWK